MKFAFFIALSTVILSSISQASSTVNCVSDQGTNLTLIVDGATVLSAQWQYIEWGGNHYNLSPANIAYRGSTASVAGAGLQYVVVGDYTCTAN